MFVFPPVKAASPKLCENIRLLVQQYNQYAPEKYCSLFQRSGMFMLYCLWVRYESCVPNDLFTLCDRLPFIFQIQLLLIFIFPVEVAVGLPKVHKM